MSSPLHTPFLVAPGTVRAELEAIDSNSQSAMQWKLKAAKDEAETKGEKETVERNGSNSRRLISVLFFVVFLQFNAADYCWLSTYLIFMTEIYLALAT